MVRQKNKASDQAKKDSHPAVAITDTTEYKPSDLDMYTVLKDVVEKGLVYIGQQDRKPGTYRSVWSLNLGEDGMPHFSEDGVPPRYIDLFNTHRDEEARRIIQPWLDFVDARENLSEYFKKNLPTVEAPEIDITERTWFEQRLIDVAEYLMERYLHMYPEAPFSDENFDQVYAPMERGILLEKLPVQVVIPLPLVYFDSDGFELGKAARIWRMDESFQLARMNNNLSNNKNAPEHLISNATHALILDGFTIDNRRNMLGPGGLALQVYTRELVANVQDYLGIVRLVTSYDVGFVQLLVRPVGWVHEYEAHLPYVDGITTIYSYPRQGKVPLYGNVPLVVASEDVSYISKRSLCLSSLGPTHRLRVALSRLNSCLSRESEQDAMLDAAIGLEAMLNDAGQDLTYKIALRTCALIHLSRRPDYDRKEAYKEVLHVYAYRSAIAHGNAKSNKATYMQNGESIRTLHLAILYLRMVMAVLLDNPQYSKEPTTIDTELIVSKL